MLCEICSIEFIPRHPKQKICGSQECKRIRGNKLKAQSKKRHFEQGFCYECYKNPVIPGRKKCSACYKRDANRRTNVRASHPGYNMFANSKRRAKELGVPFEIGLDDLMVPEFCPVLGIRLERGIKTIHDASPTVDRIVPELGYVKGNIVVMSRRANQLKNNATIQELIALGEWAKCQAV